MYPLSRRYVVGLILSLAAVLGTADVTHAARGYELKKDIVYASPGGHDLMLDAYLPKTDVAVPAVLVVHGGAWQSGDRHQLSFYAIRLARAGYAAFAINYRLAPEFKFPAQIEDCRSALKFIRKKTDTFGIDPTRIGAIGYSAGGHLVALLATQSDLTVPKSIAEDVSVKAVVAGGAPCDFTFLPPDENRLSYWLGGSQRDVPQVYKDASPATYITPADPPILFYHGEVDELVPILSPQDMVQRLRKAGVETDLIIVKNATHIPAALNGNVLNEAIAFFDKHLKSDAKPAN